MKKNLSTRLAYARRQNWRDFFLGYLEAAKTCAQSYLNYEKKINKSGTDYGKFAFIPAFWNFKHAIELALKYIAIMKERIPQKINDIKITKTHDIRFLANGLIKQKKITREQAGRLIEISEKYINLKPLTKLLESKQDPLFNAPYPALHDPENIFFKYPEGAETHIGFEYYLYIDLFFVKGVYPKSQKEKMQSIMIELKKDTKSFSNLCGKIFNS